MTNLSDIRRVLGHRDFRFLWLAQSASVIGDNIVLVALALFVVAATGSATDLGLVLAAQSLPLVAFLLIGGVWADRLPRHRVMIATDLVRFALHALLAALIFTGTVRDLAGGRDRDAVRQRRGVLPPRRQRAAAADRPRGRTSSRRPRSRRCPTTSPNSPGRRSPRCSCSARAPAGRSRSTPPRSSLSAAFLTRVPPARARERRRPPSARRAAPRIGVGRDPRGRARGARARVGVGDARCRSARRCSSAWRRGSCSGPLVAQSQYGHIGVYGLVEAALGFGTIVGSLVGHRLASALPDARWRCSRS